MCLQRSPSTVNYPIGIRHAHSFASGNRRTTLPIAITGAHDGAINHEPPLETLASSTTHYLHYQKLEKFYQPSLTRASDTDSLIEIQRNAKDPPLDIQPVYASVLLLIIPLLSLVHLQYRHHTEYTNIPYTSNLEGLLKYIYYIFLFVVLSNPIRNSYVAKLFAIGFGSIYFGGNKTQFELSILILQLLVISITGARIRKQYFIEETFVKIWFSVGFIVSIARNFGTVEGNFKCGTFVGALLCSVAASVVCRLRCRTTAPSRPPVRIIAAAALVLVAATALTIAARCCYASTNNIASNTHSGHSHHISQPSLVELSLNLNSIQLNSISDNRLNSINPRFYKNSNRLKRALRTTAPSNRNVPATILNDEKGNNNHNNNRNILNNINNSSNIVNISNSEYSVIVRTLNDTNVQNLIHLSNNNYKNTYSKEEVLVNSASAGRLSANYSTQVSERIVQDKATETGKRLMPSVHVHQQPADTVRGVIEAGIPDHHQHQLQQSPPAEDNVPSNEQPPKPGGGSGSGLIALVVSATLLTATLGLITCVVSHYRGGAGGNDGGGAPPTTNTPPAPQDAAAAAATATVHCISQQQHQPVHITAPMLSVMSASAAAGVGGVGAAMDNAGMGGGHHHRHHHHHHVSMSRELAAQRDRQVRLHSVHTDLELDLPPSIALPDGEELPYGSSARLHIRDPEQESEIYQKCIRPPPNRTVFESESPPPYRSSSAGLLGSLGGSTSSSSGGSTSDWSGGSTPLVVRCHSMSSSSSTSKHHRSEPQKTDFLQRTVKIFTGKKSQPSPAPTAPTAPTLPVVIVPTRPRHPHQQNIHQQNIQNSQQLNLPSHQQQQGSQSHSQGAPPRTSSRSGHV